MHGHFSITGGTCPGCPLSLRLWEEVVMKVATDEEEWGGRRKGGGRGKGKNEEAYE